MTATDRTSHRRDDSRDEAVQIVERAAVASATWAELAPSARTSALRAVAAELDSHGDELVSVARAESQLPEARLCGELLRTTFQLAFFADLVDEGSHLRATIDHEDSSWPPGPRPDLRRVMQPIGPVAVFAASNFPFAFSVAGGDTASALAAGCAVVLKVHPGHPALSEMTGDLVKRAMARSGAPSDVVQLLFGEDAGRCAVEHPLIRAVSFTGSLAGGRALFDLACGRPEPIPFYGEMGSLNPVFVTVSAARDRGTEILAGFRDSFTMGVGQFCTKPGLLVVPDTLDIGELVDGVRAAGPAPMLSERICDAFRTRLDVLRSIHGLRFVVDGAVIGRREVAPSLVTASVATVLDEGDRVLGECFGPVSVVAAYRDEDELVTLAESLEGQLTASVHGAEGDDVLERLIPVLTARAGRVIHGGWPTGVAVSWAMQHGGPYPATTSPGHTSVGAAAIERFLRPVTYQSMAARFLPPALQDGNPLGIPRTVDGQLVPAPGVAPSLANTELEDRP